MPFEEQEFLDWLKATGRGHERLAVGIGDDGAVWTGAGGAPLVAVMDSVVEGRHFRSGTPLSLVGRKALARNLSDLAAMGARPLFALASAVLPASFSVEDAREITGGMRQLGAEWNCPLAGGDTSVHDGELILCVAMLGEPFPGGPVRRSGARPGDAIFVTGRLGGAWRCDRHLAFTPRLRESELLCGQGPPSAMMDISDGLLLDLHRLADASGLGFRIDADRIPGNEDAGLEQALSDGEDYELLFTWPACRRLEVPALGLPAPATEIGLMQEAGRILVAGGRAIPAPRSGYLHG